MHNLYAIALLQSSGGPFCASDYILIQLDCEAFAGKLQMSYQLVQGKPLVHVAKVTIHLDKQANLTKPDERLVVSRLKVARLRP